MKNSVLILGAGRPSKGDVNPALHDSGSNGRVLDWLIRATDQLQPDRYFIGGYQSDAVKNIYPGLKHIENPYWRSTGAASSFFCATLGLDRDHYVSYSDIIYRPEAVARVAESTADIAVLVDTSWRTRVPGRTQIDLARLEKACLASGSVTRLGEDIPVTVADAEFVGFVKLSAIASDFLRNKNLVPASVRSGSLSQMVEYLRTKGMSVEAIDVSGDWLS